MSFQNPMLYNELLQRRGLLDDIYNAVNSLDGAAVVLEAYKLLSITNAFPRISKSVKNRSVSLALRNRGNIEYESLMYHDALRMYNKALLFAPKDSLEMLLAYSNRSSILFHLNAYAASINDIEACRKLGCTGDLAKRLNKRYNKCQQLLCNERDKNDMLLCDFSQGFFKFDVKKHPEIPCLSADIDIVCESGERKAVAAKDINVGTVLAIETAFVSCSLEDKRHTSCHYCQKMTLNLIPCDNCCDALFCNDECKERCSNEYHNIECQIMDILQTVDVSLKHRLAIQAFLKLKNACKNWSTLIKEADNIGASRQMNSSLNEIYDVENFSSILCFKQKRNFIFGSFYNSSFICAAVLQHLEKIDGFFPASKSECLEAMKCFGKLYLMLLMNSPIVDVMTSAEAVRVVEVVTYMPRSFGFFPFTGKLKHSCEPNLLVLGLDNQVALVAIRPITKMTELTISYVGHWYDYSFGDCRSMKIYQGTQNVCRCRVCKGGWNKTSFQQSQMDSRQKKVYRAWENLTESLTLPHKDPNFFWKTCKGLTVLDGSPNTREHHELFRHLRMQLGLCQFAATRNQMVIQ